MIGGILGEELGEKSELAWFSQWVTKRYRYLTKTYFCIKRNEILPIIIKNTLGTGTDTIKFKQIKK